MSVCVSALQNLSHGGEKWAAHCSYFKMKNEEMKKFVFSLLTSWFCLYKELVKTERINCPVNPEDSPDHMVWTQRASVANKSELAWSSSASLGLRKLFWGCASLNAFLCIIQWRCLCARVLSFCKMTQAGSSAGLSCECWLLLTRELWDSPLSHRLPGFHLRFVLGCQAADPNTEQASLTRFLFVKILFLSTVLAWRCWDFSNRNYYFSRILQKDRWSHVLDENVYRWAFNRP